VTTDYCLRTFQNTITLLPLPLRTDEIMNRRRPPSRYSKQRSKKKWTTRGRPSRPRQSNHLTAFSSAVRQRNEIFSAAPECLKFGIIPTVHNLQFWKHGLKPRILHSYGTVPIDNMHNRLRNYEWKSENYEYEASRCTGNPHYSPDNLISKCIKPILVTRSMSPPIDCESTLATPVASEQMEVNQSNRLYSSSLVFAYVSRQSHTLCLFF
jgi:hypothetical protein